jgi:hypothetical protein
VGQCCLDPLLDVLLEPTSALEAPLTLATLRHWHWHWRLFAAGPRCRCSPAPSALSSCIWKPAPGPARVAAGGLAALDRLHNSAAGRAGARGPGPPLVSHPLPLWGQQRPPGPCDHRPASGPDCRAQAHPHPLAAQHIQGTSPCAVRPNSQNQPRSCRRPSAPGAIETCSSSSPSQRLCNIGILP